jgi:T5SS/PEP-CTERM-associated repeat protein
LPNATTDAQINNGGTAQLFDPLAKADNLVLGSLAANSGTLEIIGGALSVNTFEAGTNGMGTLRILNQGRLTSTGAFVGGDIGSHGTATVDGAMSKWDAGNVLNVGFSGEGALSVLNGGSVTSKFTSVGNDSGSTGTLIVDGAGSSHSVMGDMTVGPQGVGVVTIRNGASAANANGILGELGGSGTVNVDGPGTTWTNGVVAVGITGTGTLNVTAGAVVSGTNGRIAREPNSQGTAIVDGPGSQWNSTGVFTIANNSAGKLVVRNGGVVSAQLGMTVQQGGRLEGDGTVVANVTNNQTVAPGANVPGTLHITGNYTQNAAATISINLASATSFDRLAVTGTATLAGALAVQLDGGYVPQAGSSFDVLDWGARVGTFAVVSLPALPSPLAWSTSSLYSSGVVSVTSPFLAADFDENHSVAAADLVRWNSGYGTLAGATHLQGDADFDADVDGADVLVWQRQLGQSSPLVSVGASVPEPAAGLLAALTAVFRLHGRKDKAVRKRRTEISPCHPTLYDSSRTRRMSLRTDFMYRPNFRSRSRRSARVRELCACSAWSF